MLPLIGLPTGKGSPKAIKGKCLRDGEHLGRLAPPETTGLEKGQVKWI